MVDFLIEREDFFIIMGFLSFNLLKYEDLRFIYIFILEEYIVSI